MLTQCMPQVPGVTIFHPQGAGCPQSAEPGPGRLTYFQ